VGEYRSSTWHPDPARLGAGILTGIGFLGAGVIVQERDFVRGVTTASLIWLVTILGLCFGSGRLLLGITGFGIAFFTLHFLRYVEHLIRRESYAQVLVQSKIHGPSAREITEVLTRSGLAITNFELMQNAAENTRAMRFSVSFKRNLIELPEKLINELMRFPGVLSAEWK
jgi:putative Mg2+ transporter-C (MgtC) family protein